MPIRSLLKAVTTAAVLATSLAGASAVRSQEANRHAQRLISDDAANVWQTVASDGVSISVEQVESGDGDPILRIEYSFDAGAGFGIARRPFDSTLGENYRFRYRVRGQGPANDLEFKLLDKSGDNVWWVNRRAFMPPADWTLHTNRRRHFEFAWGPSGGEPIEQTSWLEFAIASHDGGEGVLLIEGLEFEPLPPEMPYTGTPTAVDRMADGVEPRDVGADGRVGIEPTLVDGRGRIEVSFGAERTLSALSIDWAEAEACSYTISPIGSDAERRLGSIDRSTGGRDLVWLGECDISGLRIDLSTTGSSLPELKAIKFIEPTEARSENDLLRRLASESPGYAMPRAFHDVQTAWTASGAPGHAGEAIISVKGRVEFDKGGPSIEPFMIYADGSVVGWEGAMHEQHLAGGFLPIPTVVRRDGATELRVTVVSTGDADASSCLVEYAVTNLTASNLDASLLLAARPMQVLPHWQRLNVVGGFSPLRSVDVSDTEMRLNGDRPVFSVTPAGGAIAWDLQDSPLPDVSARNNGSSATLEQPRGFAAGAWRYPISLAPGETASVVIEAPYADADGRFTGEPAVNEDGFAEALVAVADNWTELTGRVHIRLPEHASHLERSIRSTIAYLLINRDGPSLQPGSRTYERSWIRDGAISSAALLAFGHDEAVREFLDWYAGYSFESGKVPCVVDHRGPDPVDEHDSTGQLLFALARHARTTGDMSLLHEHRESIDAAVAYLESLIAQRSTEAYEGTAYFGLVPESISHEGYSAKPMHSYWDCFFVLQGLRDAAWIAGELGDSAEQQRRTALAETFARNLHDSIRRATREQSVEYIPGCVELGDFDPTSTAVALAPLRIADALPQDLLDTTLAMYTDFFESRRLGQREWFDYTPYELRVVGAMHIAGQHDQAHRMADWFLAQQTPVGWNQWPEVVYADAAHPGFVGDIPHTWCATGLVNSLVTGLIHLAEGELVIGAGVPDDWYTTPEGFSVDGLRTEFGSLHYGASTEDGVVSITVGLRDGEAGERDVLVSVPMEAVPIDTIIVNGTKADGLEQAERHGRSYVRIRTHEPATRSGGDR